MYVCVCNAITEDDVHGCLAGGGCGTAKEVKAACGFKPGCGSCTKRLHAMVSEYRTASELADALTGGPMPLAAVPDAPDAPGAPVLPGAVERPAADAAVPPAERGTAPPTAA
ncbi:(2Fe-2S)-binding protein [Actinomadura opuntiae]|uniref:(2Fe-2S)-binding protein n=1 Tax=Actinomadura sp. OS1-43 TaxID=604315 RepID=UPI00255AA90D|nr:(2Fe-2S)-binding protein [Actinomadura sp. OS1-43]MDL4814730.1 (2Fe-2S)-binding protein [Actinomadura sp. OS1-43]